jgi:hypothetical protein
MNTFDLVWYGFLYFFAALGMMNFFWFFGEFTVWFSGLEIRLQHMKRDIESLTEKVNER